MTLMPRVTTEHEKIAREFAAPIVLRVLARFTAQDIADAVKSNLNITKWLKENPQALAKMKLILVPIPFTDQVGPYIRSKPWLRWFINNELKHNRPDLYAQFTYDPKAFNWLYRNMRRLSKLLFE